MKILIVLSRFPYPLEKGDKLRAYHQIRLLSKKHEIMLFALNDKKITNEHFTHVKQFCSQIETVYLSKFSILFNLFKTLFSKLPFQVGYFYSSKAQKKLDAFILKHKPDHIFCQLIRTAEYIKSYQNTPKTLDYLDAFSKSIERRMATEPFYLKPIFNSEYKRLVKYEKEVFSIFKNKIIISKQDRDSISHPEKEKITLVSLGVDSDYFKPIERKKEFDILFNGNMNYPSNIKSAEYLVNKILPLVLKKRSDTTVLISGANPSKEVLSLQSDKVKVTGWVDDVRESFAKSKIMVAPMLISTGLQFKLLEAMAMQIPCITSTLANNALGAENKKHILIADTPEQYVDHIIRLLNDEKKAEEIGVNGYHFVTENYNWEKETDKLEKLICS